MQISFTDMQMQSTRRSFSTNEGALAGASWLLLSFLLAPWLPMTSYMRRWRRGGSADGGGHGEDRAGCGDDDSSHGPPTEGLLKTFAENATLHKAKEVDNNNEVPSVLRQAEVMDQITAREGSTIRSSTINDEADITPSQPPPLPSLPLPSAPVAEVGVDVLMGAAESTATETGTSPRLLWRAEGFSSPSNQPSMPKPSRSQAATRSEDPITQAPTLVPQDKPGQQRPSPSKQSSRASQAAALHEVHWLMNNGSEEERRTALQTLATLSSAENLPAGLLADTIRTAKDCVEFLCSMLTDATLVEAALVALGNFGIEANDDDMLRVGTYTYTTRIRARTHAHAHMHTHMHTCIH